MNSVLGPSTYLGAGPFFFDKLASFSVIDTFGAVYIISLYQYEKGPERCNT